MKKNGHLPPLSIFIFFLLQTAQAQNGGTYTFAFLKQSPSARLTGLNQSQIALRDDDVNLATVNPALLNPLMHTAVAINYNNLLSDISNSSAAFGYRVEKLKLTFQANLQMMNYGVFKLTDEFGNQQGSFRANEFALTVGAGRQLNERFSVGANLRFINSQLEAYSSAGLAADLAGAYFNPDKNFGATVLLRNVGAQLSTYVPEADRENLPYDLQIGFTKKLAKAPFRLSVAAVDLLRWQLRYQNPTDESLTSLTGESNEASALSKGFDNLFRHLRFGGEVVFGKTESFRLRVGYAHQTRRELSVQNIRSTAGFSFGAGFRVRKFRIDYGLSRQHVAGGTNHLTLSTNFGAFKK